MQLDYHDVTPFHLSQTPSEKAHHCSLNLTEHFPKIDNYSLSFLLVSSPLHLIPDVVGHLLVEAELLPLLVEVGGLAVPAHVAVEAASDVGVEQVLAGLDVQGRE